VSYLELSKRNSKKRKIVAVAMLAFIIGINFVSGWYLRDNLANAMWDSDDVYHISAANSFRENKSFEIDFIGNELFRTDERDWPTRYPTISYEQAGKGPIDFMLLGSFYQILDTQPKDLYYHGGYFSNILTSSFLILFFYFCYKKFSLFTAFFVTLLIVLGPWFMWNSARVMVYAPFYIFGICAFFFLQKKYTHYILFGLFSGLAHLSHPFGIFLGTSYCIFLLINKEIKGAFLVFITWQLTLIPWFVRNYYFFSDIGFGLYIPFSEKVSSFLTFLPRATNDLIFESQTLHNIITNNYQMWEPFDTFKGMFNEFNSLYAMGSYIILILSLSFFAFIEYPCLRRNLKSILVYIGIIIWIIFVLDFIGSAELQIGLVFIAPPLLLYFLYKKHREIFSKVPRLYLYTAFFCFFSFVLYYIISLVFIRTTPEIKAISFAFYLLTPLAIFSLHKIIKKIFSPKYHPFIAVLFLGLILSPFLIQMGFGAEHLNSYVLNSQMSQQAIDVNSKALQVIPKDAKTSSNLPALAFLHTQLPSIILAPESWDMQKINNFYKHYDVDYVIFYDLQKNSGMNFLTKIKDSPVNDAEYIELYSSHDSSIYKIVYLDDATIETPVLYLNKALKAQDDKQFLISNKIISEIMTTNFESIKTSEGLCTRFTQAKITNEAKIVCQKLLDKDPKNKIAFSNLIETNIKEKNEESLLNLKQVLEKDIFEENTIDLVPAWAKLTSYLLEQNPKQLDKYVLLLEDAKRKYAQNDINAAITQYSILSTVFPLEKPTEQSKFEIYMSMNDFEQSLNSYEKLVDNYLLQRQILNDQKNEILTLYPEYKISKNDILIPLTSLYDLVQRSYESDDHIGEKYFRLLIDSIDKINLKLLDPVDRTINADVQSIQFKIMVDFALKISKDNKINDAETIFNKIFGMEKYNLYVWTQYSKFLSQIGENEKNNRALEVISSLEQSQIKSDFKEEPISKEFDDESFLDTLLNKFVQLQDNLENESDLTKQQEILNSLILLINIIDTNSDYISTTQTEKSLEVDSILPILDTKLANLSAELESENNNDREQEILKTIDLYSKVKNKITQFDVLCEILCK
jgi:hypothetical protein